MKAQMKTPERCHIHGGTVMLLIIYYNDGKAFRYIVCKPAFFDTCEKLIEKYNKRGIEFIKINSESEKEYLRRIEAECYRAKMITYS
jgi:hypothetical protein